ncbi:acetyltransferase [Thermoactinomyces vulgaris]|jgi:ribosomal protein S18 acetylase RimI-like enzyme|nr:acetyltransferase [Thermoactinomyces vulgaris]
MNIQVRPYTLADFPQLLEIQKESFPPPFPEDLLWNRDQISAHVHTFPEGALLAEVDGVAAGSATALIVHYTGKPHTWAEVSDNGYIKGSHAQDGDSLYGIDVCVRPQFRGQGIAQALYQARKELVVRLGLTRLIAGCRIPSYHRYQQALSVDAYVRKVKQNEIRDSVLSFMLNQGLEPLQILEHYLDDEESCHFAVLVEWKNPYKKEG